MGDAEVSYCECNIFEVIFKWAEGINYRALGPHRPLLPSLLWGFSLPWVQCPGAVPQSQGPCSIPTRVSVLKALGTALSFGKIRKHKKGGKSRGRLPGYEADCAFFCQMPKVQSERLFCLRGLIWTVPSGPAPPSRPSSSTAWRWSFSAASTSWGGSAPSSPASSISPRLR